MTCDCVDWQVVPDVLKNCSALIFRVRQSKKNADPEDEGTVIHQNISNYLLRGTLSYPRRFESSAAPL
jgi:hypothetical protein